MSWGLMHVVFKNKPSNKPINLNDGDYEYDNSPIYRKVRGFSSIVHKDIYDAVNSMSDQDKDVINAIPYLTDGIKDTAKMTNNIKKQAALRLDKETLQSEWKVRALAVKQKTCYSCNSKIAQKHEQINNQRNTSESCPICKSTDYLLTKGARTKIQKIDEKIIALKKDYITLKENELQKKLKQKNPKISWLVGGWLHESELPRGF